MAKFGSYTQIDALADDDIGLVKDASSGGTRYFTMQQLGDYVDSDQGFVTGPASATDNAVVRFDTTTGKLVQDSSFIVDDSGNVTAGAWTATDVAVLHGGTGASTAEDARTNLGLVIGTNVQAYDATLQSLSSLGTVADRLAYTTGVDTWAETAFTAFGRSLVDDADASTAQATLGLVIGTNVQAYSANLAAIAALAVTDGNIIVGNGSTWVAESGSTARTSLGLAIGTDVQAYSATLAAVVAGTYTGAASITTVGTIATGTWQGTPIANAYVAGLDQNVLTTSSPAFAGLTVASDLALAAGSITSVSGAISFGNENLTTTGTLSAGATTVTTLNLTDNLTITDSNVEQFWVETGVTADNSTWGIAVNAEVWNLKVLNDAKSAGVNFMSVERTANTVDSITLAATSLLFNGATTVTGTLTASSYLQGTTANGYLDLRGDSAATNYVRVDDTGLLTVQGGNALVNKTSGWVYSAVQSSTKFVGLASDSSFDPTVFWLSGSALRFATTSDKSGTGYAQVGRFDSSGNLILGTATATSSNAQFYATKTYSAASGSDYPAYFNYTQSVASTGGIRSVAAWATNSHTSGTVGSVVGVLGFARATGSGGTTTSAYSFFADMASTVAGANITNAYGLYINAFTATGTITNRWGIYQAGASENNYLAGSLRIGTTSAAGSEVLRVNGLIHSDSDSIIVDTAKTPATAGATGIAGQIAWDASYIYVCTAANTWRRVAHATW